MAKLDKNAGWPGFYRIFAVFCAMILILSRTGQTAAVQGSDAWQVMSVYEGLTVWAIPALFMLWGMYALDGASSGLSAALLGRVLPTFGVLVFWGTLYAIADQLLVGGGLSFRGIWAGFVSAAQGRPYFHLWLFYPLIGLYLMQPLIQRFTSTAARSEAVYFLVLCFLFANLLPLWTAFHPDSIAAGILNRLGIHMVLGWVGLYVGGWYLRHYVIGRITEFAIYLLGILGMVLTLSGSSLLGGSRELWYGYTSPNVVLTATAFCVLFRYVLGVSDERSRRSAVSRLGKYSFGIYLVHQLWVMVFRWLGISFGFSPVIGIPFFALVLFLLSLPVAWLIHLIPAVGEQLTT